MLAPYLPIVLLFVLATAFALFSVTIAPFVGPKRFNRAKLDFYECGIEPTPQPIGPHRFPIKYFLTAMIFIVFAIETHALGDQPFALFLLVEMIIFIVTVFVAYAYVWRRGGLDWD